MIPGLDGLRALAFLIVFGFHTDYLPFGWLGVQLFFVISGYLITGILLRMRESLSVRDYFLKFYTRRFLRIFPLYYFYLLLVFAGATWLLSISYKPKVMKVVLDQLWYAALYLYNFFSASRGYSSSPFLDHLWSLSVEEQFYIFWPLLIFFVNEKHLKKLFLAGIIAGPILRFAIFLIYQNSVFETFSYPAPLPIYTLPFSYVDAFAFGAYISRFSIPNARKQLVYLSLGVPLVGFLSQFVANGKFEPFLTLGYQDSMPDAYQFIWGYTLVNYLFVVLIYCVTHEKMFVRFLDWGPLQYLGKISYGLYIYHFPIVYFFPVNWFESHISGAGILDTLTSVLILISSFAGTVLIATVSYYALEKPFLKLKERFASYMN